MRVLLDSPAQEGSLGDEALMEVIAQGVRDLGYGLGLILHDPHDFWSCTAATERIWRDTFRFDELNRYDILVSIGADVLDGEYGMHLSFPKLQLAKEAIRRGLKTSVVSFSFRHNPRCFETLKWIGESGLLCVRDKYSWENLRGIANRELVADAAFLLEPGELDEETLSWLDSGPRPVGINLVWHRTPLSLDAWVTDCVTVLERCENKRFVLIVHDRRGHDHKSLTALQSRLRGELRFVQCPSGRFAKALCGRLDWLLTSRMHLGIAALGMGTPVVCVKYYPYKDKFNGLLAHFDLEDYCVPSSCILELGPIIDRVQRERDCLRMKIQQRIGAVRKLAMGNFRALG